MTTLEELGLTDTERAGWEILTPEQEAWARDVAAERDVPKARGLVCLLRHELKWERQDYQQPPPGEWWTWVFQGGRGTGKMLDVTTPIPTPDGWAKLGDLEVGDEVFDESGRVCRITGVFDGVPERAWRLRFSDGSTLDACGDHQWVTWTHAERKAFLRCSAEADRARFPAEWPAWRAARRPGGRRPSEEAVTAAIKLVRGGLSLRAAARRTGFSRAVIGRWVRDGWAPPVPKVWAGAAGPQVRTTDEIVATLRFGRRGDTNHAIPTCGPLQLPNAELPVDPYVLGYWLGDGKATAGSFTCAPADQPNLHAALTAAGYAPHRTPRADDQTVATYGLVMDLRAAGVLGAKHVPAAYLRASTEQRAALLAGLMDSDGHAGRSLVEFSSTSRPLAEGVIELARSLGQKPVLAESRARLYGRDCGPKYRVTWRPTSPAFRLERKLDRLGAPEAQALRRHHRMVVGAEPIDPVPMRCLSVDSRHRMYLAGEAMIPTHNTDEGADWLNEHMEGPPCDPRWPGGHKALLLGPTHADVVASCVKGVSGLRAHNPRAQVVNRKDGTFVVWPNRAEAVCLGMHTEYDADRIRAQGANICTWWIDEAAVARHLDTAVNNLALGARGGVRPHGIVTTTPKPTPAYKRLLRMRGVEVTKASSHQNRHLPQFYRRIIAQWEGTRLGRQEIEGELLEDYEGALWQRDLIDADRITEDRVPGIDAMSALERVQALAVVRVGVGIDPSTWIPELGSPDVVSEDDYDVGHGIETGLVVAGIDGKRPQPEVYVFDDLSGRMAAARWAERACRAYHDWRANWVVPETNAGGDSVLATIQLTDSRVTVYREPDSKKPGVRASLGKRARAEPVAALYEQHRAHHVGEFPALEAQLCGWDPTESWSPDRLDALVWAITALKPWKVRRAAGGGGARGQFHRR